MRGDEGGISPPSMLHHAGGDAGYITGVGVPVVTPAASCVGMPAVSPAASCVGMPAASRRRQKNFATAVLIRVYEQRTFDNRS